jgi:hypothetical protein
LSGAVGVHASVVAGLSVIYSLWTRGLCRTLLFAALGNAIPVLGEHLAVNVLKVLRHHARPQARACRWPSPSLGSTSATGPSL